MTKFAHLNWARSRVGMLDMRQKTDARMLLKKLTVPALSFVIFVIGAAISSQAQATLLTLDFNVDAVQAGAPSISYDGGATDDLVATDISVDKVDAFVDGVNTGTLALEGAVLAFTSGDFISSSTSFGVTTWFFGGGGAITITGAAAGAVVPIPAGTLLLTGTVTQAVVVNVGGGSFDVSIATFIDTKDDDLVGNFGFPTGQDWSGALNISFTAVTGLAAGDSFTSITVLSGNVVNNLPEPGTLALFGFGLIAFGFLGRRYRYRAKLGV